MKSNLFKPHVALPTDHGSWVFLFSPLAIGLLIGQKFTQASLLLICAVTVAFLIRQPITVLVKISSNRRGRNDFPAALTWTMVYALLGLITLIGLIRMGFSYLLLLAVPGIPVFAWHLMLISRRLERRQVGVEIVATGVLSLAATAAYWVAKGFPDPAGWWLFLMTWLQSAASIVYAYLRLAQRTIPADLESKSLFNLGKRALLYTSFNLVLALYLGLIHLLPAWLFLPYLLQWVETMYGTFNPAVGVKPIRIGIRQLIISILFTVLFISGWFLGTA